MNLDEINGYLIRIEMLLRTILGTNDKYADELKLDFFGTLYKYLRVGLNEIEFNKFYVKYKNRTEIKINELIDNDFDFEDLINVLTTIKDNKNIL